MGQTTFNISEVSRLTGKARSTITNHLKSGRLSCIRDADDKKLIEASEIIRAYPNELELDGDGKLKSKTKRIEKENDSKADTTGHFRELLEREQQERDRERMQLLDTIEHLRADLEKSQERESRTTLLLEDQTSESDRWVKQMAEIEKRVANQELETRKYRKALIDERNRSFWIRIFG